MGMYARFVGSDLRFDAAREEELEAAATGAWADEDGIFVKAEKTASGEVVRGYWEPEMDEIPFKRVL